ncbi:uncharacterized protein EV420DRAFT_1648677 [Desarmillaria tabescens]|uniref:MYND-type domain-containing protein n=1 Tax=Armillaria tabescens TaxID=1929756 RepID=A0AA39JLP7_ARMTA|nr:uncharacterized protein EV420DRAFT_1648677 [Desarmillaria tabescens]KAK0444953.1 hypothetical protein EV420DRAFT_1648677 [Desarmillaria tabescens]
MEPCETGIKAFEYSRLLQNTLGLRFDIGVEAVDLLLYHDLESKWLAATRATRRQHALVGLSEAGAIARNLNEARRFTGDILTLENLSKEGHTLIDLLKAIIPDDISVLPKTPCHFPNAAWDSLREERQKNGTEFEKLWLAEAHMLRSKLIYHVVQLRNLGHSPHAQMDSVEKELKKKLYGGKAAKEMWKDDKAAWKDRTSRRANSCTNCLKKEEEGQKFPHCSKCWTALKRDVPYCSRECQTADYKSRHKAICGKEMGLEDAVETALKARGPPKPTVTQIGPAVEGFKRSPALLHHIFKLNRDPKTDLYIRIKEGTDSEDCFMRMDTPFPPIQNLIRAARDKAMITGDRQSAALVCHFTVWFLLAKGLDKERGWDFKAMIDEMTKEYEFPDLKKAMLELQVRQFRDPFMRPPLVRSLAPADWIGYVRISPVDMTRRIE